MRTASLPARQLAGPVRPKRLLALLGDERLVEHVRRGSDDAFEVLYERHVAGVLAFCRHMLGSREDSEDAVQQAFASAHSSLLRSERDISFKAWLYTIARNRCISILRARRPESAVESVEPEVEDLDEQVQRRAELRELLADVGQLPEDQRTALLLGEAAGLSHAEIATVLGCEVHKVKGLVFRARAGLAERRHAREVPCEDVREQLATLRGGALRRTGLRHHLQHCEGCRSFRDDVRHQRKLLALALPVVPTLRLKASVLSAAGLGSGSAGGGAAVATGLGAAGTLPAAAGTAAKLVLVGALVGGGAVAGKAVIDGGSGSASSPPAGHVAPVRGAESSAARTAEGRSTAARRRGQSKSRAARVRSARKRGAVARGVARGPADVPGSRGQGRLHRTPNATGVPRGRGAPEAPPASTPLRRGPATEKKQAIERIQGERPTTPSPRQGADAGSYDELPK